MLDDDQTAAVDADVSTETAVADVRDTSTADATEHADPEPGRVLDVDETAAEAADDAAPVHER